MTQPLPYHEVTDESFAMVAAATFTVTALTTGHRVLSGPCPRCRAAIEVPIVDVVYKSVRLAGAVAVSEQAEPVVCTCVDPHPGRPADRVGCGAYWLLYLGEEDAA